MGYYVICALVTWFFYSRRGGLLHDIERARRQSGAAVADARPGS
jgi:NNP family nitrate/nitrite transporter-like MFS transporter